MVKYYTIGDRQIIHHDCNVVPFCFAIDLSDFEKYNSENTYYRLVCTTINTKYLIPLEIVKRCSLKFKGNKNKFALRIDPRANKITYYGINEDISRYLIETKPE